MIEVEQLRKVYAPGRGLDGFSLSVKAGELCGLVGPNGAGKTTLIKILSTLVRPDSGRARVAGIDVTRDALAAKSLIGYMPDQPGLYQDMRVREYLEFFSDAFGIPPSQRAASVDSALESSGLGPRASSFVEELSFGMKQRLLLWKTLIHSPKLLLLDEPATGLDPLARIELREHLKKLHASGITILISSHILSDLEDICTRVAFINDGRNAVDSAGSKVFDIEHQAAASALYEIGVIGDAEAAARAAGAIPNARVLESTAGRLMVEISGDETAAAEFLKELITRGTVVTRFDHPASVLEERYRRLFGSRVQ